MVTFDDAKALIDYTLIKVEGMIWLFVLMIVAVMIGLAFANNRKG